MGGGEEGGDGEEEGGEEGGNGEEGGDEQGHASAERKVKVVSRSASLTWMN